MGYLALTRREMQQNLLRDGITIILGAVDGVKAKEAIEAHSKMLIMRDYLYLDFIEAS